MSGAAIKALPEGRPGQILAVGLLAVATAVLWLAIASPILQWYGARAERLDERRAVAAHMSALVEQLPGLRKILAGSASKPTDEAPRAILSGDSDAIAAASLQGVIQEMATDAGANLTSTEVLPAAQAGDFRRIALRIELNADWAVLIALLSAVETSDLQLFIDDLQFHAVADTGLGNAAAGGGAPIDASFIVIAFRSGIGGDDTPASPSPTTP